MASRYHSQISQLERDIANLKSTDATESGKEADLIGRINRAQNSANGANNPSTIKSNGISS